MVVNGRPVKRAKRRITADLYDFFDAAAGDLGGPFRTNVQVFLSRHARLLPPPSILAPSPSQAGQLLTWRVGFGLGDAAACDDVEALSPAGSAAKATVELDVVEEDVFRSKSVYCDHCRVVGWSYHPVCRKRYHFIIRNNANPLSSSHQKCLCCGALLQRMDSRCHSCNYDVTAESMEDWAHHQLEDPTHLLHGLVHANGYGHLLRVNGRDGGSRYLTGSDIMGFWDRLCRMLRIRKVTVMDISKKHGMEYRLLNAVIFGQPWYGNWGYKFGAGSFGVTSTAYEEAINTLSNLPLSIFSHSRSQHTTLHNTVALYCSVSDKQLLTLRDLLTYINQLQASHERQHPISSPRKKFQRIVSMGALSSWSKQDIERAEEVMVKVLRAVGRSQWVAWRALKGAASGSVESPGLLDCCLKGLSGKLTDDQLVVQSRFNDETKLLESYDQLIADVQRRVVKLSSDHLTRHLKYLYDGMLDPTTMIQFKHKEARDSILRAARKILDCKHFVKHYDEHFKPLSPSSNPHELHIWCKVELFDEPADYTSPPPELVVLPANATIADLKLQATKAFRETYIVFQRFQPEQVVGYNKVLEPKIKQLMDENGVVVIRGRCLAGDGKLGRFRMERGIESWEVDCTCGAKDDDGERMMACDVCGVWQHTRCTGIDDEEKVPDKFICIKCTGCCLTSPTIGD
ncbi:LOW QUALITY PROTEIN: PHD finger protein At1g33420 [Phalaenopsis equestris]|uniref:LOW QUALITY PROTEIN: PHD finger protein At1g33420 n=1 Tax=Phalaenopsis equestris TaxID=78828 RepID=UPI0009E5F817|nr:LOW QUALITY PROTEIN: PHD finger protein At1g33420 [Phalaenopsis equestris]